MYKQCPFCDRVFEIGDSDHRPMKYHIRAEHADAREPTARAAGTASGRTAD